MVACLKPCWSAPIAWPIWRSLKSTPPAACRSSPLTRSAHRTSVTWCWPSATPTTSGRPLLRGLSARPVVSASTRAVDRTFCRPMPPSTTVTPAVRWSTRWVSWWALTPSLSIRVTTVKLLKGWVLPFRSSWRPKLWISWFVTDAWFVALSASAGVK